MMLGLGINFSAQATRLLGVGCLVGSTFLHRLRICSVSASALGRQPPAAPQGRLGSSSDVLGPSWARLGVVLGRLGAALGPVGAVLGPS